jgi:hypothetical protein
MEFISPILEIVTVSDKINEVATHQDTHSQQLNMILAPRVFETLAANSIFTQLIKREDFIAFTILRLLIIDVTPCSLL